MGARPMTDLTTRAADDAAALARLRQIMAGHRTAQLILDWPESELKKLRPTPAALTQSRTGY